MSMYHLVESTDRDVDSKEILSRVPNKFLSGDPKRPLLHVDADGTQYKYALNPLIYCVMFISIVEGIVMFCEVSGFVQVVARVDIRYSLLTLT